jgi:hypothetical protein
MASCSLYERALLTPEEKGLLTLEPQMGSTTVSISNLLLIFPEILFIFAIPGAKNTAAFYYNTTVMKFSLNTDRNFSLYLFLSPPTFLLASFLFIYK